ncbi:MAG: lysophospholipase, partial [Planctomycetota bacterium]|nr:lysophospholipase [Planctomycetota bacterium]
MQNFHRTIHKHGTILSLLLAACFCNCATADDNRNSELTRIVLAGDSTVTDDSGWGKGFAELLPDRAECISLAKSGRSSRSYRTEGWWQKCLDAKPDYLLIQFGHNDQPGKGPERESAADGAFRDHLRAFVDEARCAGIKPVLVTSLTRRRWSTD